jgi:hypothetical protein
MTAPLPFDAPTLATLARLRANPIDVFGERITTCDVSSGRIMAELARKPMRVRQLADRLSVRRWALEIALVVLVACGQVVRDEEAFLTVERHSVESERA